MDIYLKVLNCDDHIMEYHYENIVHFLLEWNSDNDPDIPMLDDRVVFARVGSLPYSGVTVYDVLRQIEYLNGVGFRL